MKNREFVANNVTSNIDLSRKCDIPIVTKAESPIR